MIFHVVTIDLFSRHFKFTLHQTSALSNTAASRSKGSSNDWGCDFQTTTKPKPSEVEMSKKRRVTTLASSEAASASTASTSKYKRRHSSMLKEQNGHYHTVVSLTNLQI